MEGSTNLFNYSKTKEQAPSNMTFEKHHFEKVSIRYYSFKIDFQNNMPMISYEDELFPQTGVGKSVTNFSLSANPRYLLTSYEGNMLIVHQQNNIDEINAFHLNNSQYNIDKSNSTQSIKMSSTTDPYASQSSMGQHHFLAKNTKVTYIGTKKFDNNPHSINYQSICQQFFYYLRRH